MTNAAFWKDTLCSLRDAEDRTLYINAIFLNVNEDVTLNYHYAIKG
jgi:hypothetical protein